MSLINKMLKDLESRQDGSDAHGPRVVYEDLQAARAGKRPARRHLPTGPVVVIGLALVLGGALGWFFLGRSGSAPTPVPATPPPTVIAEAPVSPPPAETPARNAAPPVVKAPAARLPVREKPSMALSPPAPTAKPAPAKPAARTSPPLALPSPAPAVAAMPVARPGQMEKVVKPPKAGELTDAAYHEAASLLQQGRADEAEAKLRATLGQNPGHAAARELLVGVLLQRGARDEARQQLETGITHSPGHLGFYSLLARLHVDAGQEARALALLESANARAINDVEHQRFLAALYQRAGRHADAVKTYRQAVTLRPFDGRAWLGLGISLEAMEEWKDAATAYQRALAGQGLDDRLADYARQRQAFVKSK